MPKALANHRLPLAVLAVTILAMVLSPILPQLGTWPTAWTLPVNSWIGTGLGGFFEWLKPAARLFSALMAWPMAATNWLLSSAPWPLVCGLLIALGYWCGRTPMALLTAATLTFVLASGYWVPSMNTLALVAVSVPLALLIGISIGVLAYEIPRVKRLVETILDVMQTVPTFAYLTPLLLLFGFGPVVGLIASAIYAAPPMARNTLLGLERVESEIREAAAMAGTTRFQRLFWVEIPAASRQIMVGVNQCVMAALSMVIIAAVIGGFEDIGWEVLLTMRKAQFGQALLAGLVIVAFAVLIDRMSSALAESDHRGDAKTAAIIAGTGTIIGLATWSFLPAGEALALLQPAADWVDATLGAFTAAYGTQLDSIKNGAMFYGLLPLRIGLEQAVLPFTWGFAWTGTMSLIYALTGLAITAVLLWRGHTAFAIALATAFLVIHTGITNLPWPVVITGIAALAFHASGRNLALFVALALATILLAGLWERAMLSAYLCLAAVMACALIGGSLGLLAAISQTAWRILQPICDMLQTIPLFVFLIPVLMFFQIGEFSAFLAICAYAIVPMIRYTRHGLVNTPPDLIEAATANGCTPFQILASVRAPYAAPTILLGLNQTILYAFAMLVIAALIGTTGLGQAIYLALGKADVGMGIAAGAAMALLALIADRLVQAFADERRKALGL